MPIKLIRTNPVPSSTFTSEQGQHVHTVAISLPCPLSNTSKSATPSTETLTSSLSTSSPMPLKQIRTDLVPSSAFTFKWYHGLPHDQAISSRLLLVRMILLIFPIFPHLSLVTTQAYVYCIRVTVSYWAVKACPPGRIVCRNSMYYISTIIASQSCPSSSSSPSTSGRAATAVRSLSLTNPIKLHSPTHINARVDCTERRLRRCDNRIRPLLKIRSTLTDVARKV